MEVAEGDEEVPVDAEVADEVFAEEEVELAAEEEDGEVLVPLDVAAAWDSESRSAAAVQGSKNYSRTR